MIFGEFISKIGSKQGKKKSVAFRLDMFIVVRLDHDKLNAELFANDGEKTMNTMVQAEIPNQLWQQAQNLVQHGCASNLQEVINEALRRYLDSHQEVLAESFIQEDIEWGLHGDN